jgi:hypothetical protein
MLCPTALGVTVEYGSRANQSRWRPCHSFLRLGDSNERGHYARGEGTHFTQGWQCRCTCTQMYMPQALCPLDGCQPRAARSNIQCATQLSVVTFANCSQGDGRRSSNRATAGTCIILNTPLAKWLG